MNLNLNIYGAGGGLSRLAQVRAFSSRVKTDGGTVLALSCLNTKLKALGAAEPESKLIYRFETRIGTDAGTLEAKVCLANCLEDLREI